MVGKSDRPRVVLILQARMGSTRLPGKSMMDLAGKPLLGHILERVKRCRMVDEIVLATSDLPRDDVLAELARDYGITVYRGSESDLVDRYYQAARASRADIVLRLPADNPTPEPAEIDRIVAHHLTGQSDFSSNLGPVLGNGYPDGIGAEAFNMEILEEIWQDVTDPKKREHLHLSFFDYQTQKPTNPGRYRVGTVECPAEFRRPDLVLDVNTQEEYEFMRELYQYLYPSNPQFHITDIIKWYNDVYSKKGGKAGRKKMICCFDIDGTLCTNTEGDYENAQPNDDIIARVNRIYNEGHHIILYTARGSTTGIDWRSLTEAQLKDWGVRYHELVMGKPTADIYIDDKAVNTIDWESGDYSINLSRYNQAKAKEEHG